MAEGLDIFLREKGQTWNTKSCTAAFIYPTTKEGGWGAVRVEIAVNSLSGLIKLRKVMKKHVEAAVVGGNSVRTRKHTASSSLYSMDVEAQWSG